MPATACHRNFSRSPHKAIIAAGEKSGMTTDEVIKGLDFFTKEETRFDTSDHDLS
jgi:hypothetical protein